MSPLFFNHRHLSVASLEVGQGLLSCLVGLDEWSQFLVSHSTSVAQSLEVFPVSEERMASVTRFEVEKHSLDFCLA